MNAPVNAGTTVRAPDLRDADEVRRYTPLAESGAESRQQLAQLRAAADQSAANARAQAAALAAQQRQVATLEAQIGQSRAQRQGAAAPVDGVFCY